MRLRSLVLTAPLLVLTLGGSAEAGPRRALAGLAAVRVPLRHASFDWDDNIAVMCTRMYLRPAAGGPELALSTAQWAHAKHELGKPGTPLEHYVLDLDKHTGAFRDLGENGRENLFLRDLKLTLAGQRDWRGPSWEAFVDTVSTRVGARETSIITAREHRAESIHEGLRHLQAEGLIRHLIPLENIYAVSRPGIVIAGRPLVGATPERKLTVQRALLDELERSAQLEGAQHSWHFSDDDWDNYAATRAGLVPDVQAGRWKKVVITLHFTGLNHATEAPQSMKLVPPALY